MFRLLTSCSLLAAGALLAAGCQTTPTYSDSPEIAPGGVTLAYTTEDGGTRLVQPTVRVTWTDGDGDLGFLASDTNEASLAKRNYFISLQKKVGANFLTITPAFSLNGRFKDLAPDQKARPLRGDLSYVVNGTGFVLGNTVGQLPDGSNARLRAGDVIRFTIMIQDRAGHQSNTITTEEAIL